MAKLIELKCPYCKKPMDKLATACPACKASGADNQPLTKNQKLGGCGCLTLAAILGIGMMVPSADKLAVKKSDNVSTTQSAHAASVFARKIVDLGQQCDAASKNMMEAMNKKGASPLDVYPVASEAHDLCKESWFAIGQLDVPDGLPAKAEDTLEKAKDTCHMAYFRKKSGIETVMEVLDGDSRPSKFQELNENSQASQVGIMACVAGLTIGVESAGGKGDQLKIAE